MKFSGVVGPLGRGQRKNRLDFERIFIRHKVRSGFFRGS